MNDKILIVIAIAFVFIFFLYMSIYWYKRYRREHEELETLKRGMKGERRVVLTNAKILENSFDGWLENFGYEKRNSALFVPIIFEPSTGNLYPVDINYRIIAEANFFRITSNLPNGGYNVIWTDFHIPLFEFVDGVCGQIELLGEPYSFKGLAKKPK